MDIKQVQLRSYFEKERERLAEKLRQMEDENFSKDDREGNAFSKITEAADGSAEMEKGAAFKQTFKDRLSGVEHTLRKLDEGTYGICDGCRQAIDPARLEALLEASLCRKCVDLQKKQSRWTTQAMNYLATNATGKQ